MSSRKKRIKGERKRLDTFLALLLFGCVVRVPIKFSDSGMRCFWVRLPRFLRYLWCFFCLINRDSTTRGGSGR